MKGFANTVGIDRWKNDVTWLLFDGKSSETLASNLANAIAVTQDGERRTTTAVEFEARQLLQVLLRHERNTCKQQEVSKTWTDEGKKQWNL